MCTGCAAGKLVYAEVSVSFDQIEELDDAVPADGFRREALPYEAAFLAGKAFLAYRRRGGPQEAHMTEHTEAISKLLHEAGETHHRVYRIVDGDDPDWASWYADWLISPSELPQLLGHRPVRSELVYMLVKLDKQYTADGPSEPWEQFYAQRIADHFTAAG